MTDLADFDTGVASDKGAEIELLHPTTNAKLGVFFTILGKDSEVFREHLRDRTNERMRKEAMLTRRGITVPPMTAEEAEAKAVELLVLCTTGWRTETKVGDKVEVEPTITMNGEKLTFSVANAKRVYEQQIWIVRQIDNAIGDLENFIKS